jgi:hypothetical protein
VAIASSAVAALSRAFERVSVGRLTTLIASIVPRDVVPDPEATAWVLYAAAIQTAYGLAGHIGPPPIGAERARQALTDVIERALVP